MFIACSDLHIHDKAPVNRIEKDWSAVCLDKLRQVLSKARVLKCKVRVAGDFFDKSSHSPALVNGTLALLNEYGDVFVEILPGNHDLKNHSQSLLPSSSIMTIGFLDNVTIVGSDWLSVTEENYVVDFIPFGDELTHYGGDVAIIHEFVWNKEPWPGAPISGNWKNIAKKMKGYKLIIIGDNHQPFIKTHKKCTLLNCGSMLRKNIDQQDHKPAFYVIGDDLSIETIPFKISKDVFDTSASDLVKKKNKAIQEVAEQMKEGITFSLDFKKNLKEYFAKNKTEKSIREIIEGAMSDD